MDTEEQAAEQPLESSAAAEAESTDAEGAVVAEEESDEDAAEAE